MIMSKTLTGVTGLGAIFSTLLFFADAAYTSPDLAKKSGCFDCHSIDKQAVGPSYQTVAAKYQSDATAEAKLIEKVKHGGSGVWGSIAMLPNTPQVKDEDVKTLVKWVLSLAGGSAPASPAPPNK
jgi:cytochrome c